MRRLILLIFTSLLLSLTYSQEVKDKNLPHIEFEETVFDFGTIAYHSDGTHVFKFKNTGKEALLISDVKATCGCTTPSYSKEPVKKGKSGEITVKYDTRRVGSFSKSITVTSNADNATVRLTIKGVVQKNSQNAG